MPHIAPSYGVNFLGDGGRVRCGEQILADEFAASTNKRDDIRYCNVCRPFDEAQAYRDEIDREWYRIRWCVSLTDEHGLPITKPGEIDALNTPRDMRPFKATIPKSLDAWIQFATPPNHGHGAACGCGSFHRDMTREFAAGQLALDVERSRAAGSAIMFSPRNEIPGVIVAKKLWVEANGDVTAQFGAADCAWCAGTGRIVCDDERAGRVSPSHAAGGYEEWLNRDAFERGRTGRMPAFNWPQPSGIPG